MTLFTPEVRSTLNFSSLIQERFYLENLLESDSSQDINAGQEVIEGLTRAQKSLPPKYLYDAQGSQLFEQICDLPEYYPTRTEAAILQEYAPEIAETIGICELVEIGSGSSTKTRLLLNAYQMLDYPLYYVPIDVSASILESTCQQLSLDYPGLKIHGLIGTYEVALQRLTSTHLPARTVCFLGSTIGNFPPSDCDRFLSQVTNTLNKGDYFLLGADLQKPIDIIEAAYNDSQGVTAAFSLNLLNHLNWRFQGNFAPNRFKHHAFYNQSADQIEIHLVSLESQTVRLEALDLDIEFALGETILTEISRKFNLEKMEQLLAAHGLKTIQVWTDSNQWFGLFLSQFL